MQEGIVKKNTTFIVKHLFDFDSMLASNEYKRFIKASIIEAAKENRSLTAKDFELIARKLISIPKYKKLFDSCFIQKNLELPKNAKIKKYRVGVGSNRQLESTDCNNGSFKPNKDIIKDTNDIFELTLSCFPFFEALVKVLNEEYSQYGITIELDKLLLQDIFEGAPDGTTFERVKDKYLNLPKEIIQEAAKVFDINLNEADKKKIVTYINDKLSDICAQNNPSWDNVTYQEEGKYMIMLAHSHSTPLADPADQYLICLTDDYQEVIQRAITTIEAAEKTIPSEVGIRIIHFLPIADIYEKLTKEDKIKEAKTFVQLKTFKTKGQGKLITNMGDILREFHQRMNKTMGTYIYYNADDQRSGFKDLDERIFDCQKKASEAVIVNSKQEAELNLVMSKIISNIKVINNQLQANKIETTITIDPQIIEKNIKKKMPFFELLEKLYNGKTEQLKIILETEAFEDRNFLIKKEKKQLIIEDLKPTNPKKKRKILPFFKKNEAKIESNTDALLEFAKKNEIRKISSNSNITTTFKSLSEKTPSSLFTVINPTDIDAIHKNDNLAPLYQEVKSYYLLLSKLNQNLENTDLLTRLLLLKIIPLIQKRLLANKDTASSKTEIYTLLNPFADHLFALKLITNDSMPNSENYNNFDKNLEHSIGAMTSTALTNPNSIKIFDCFFERIRTNIIVISI